MGLNVNRINSSLKTSSMFWYHSNKPVRYKNNISVFICSKQRTTTNSFNINKLYFIKCKVIMRNI